MYGGQNASLGAIVSILGAINDPFIGEASLDMSYLSALIASFRRDEEGQGLAEYALILALIAIVAIVALTFLGGQISTILSVVGSSI